MVMIRLRFRPGMATVYTVVCGLGRGWRQLSLDRPRFRPSGTADMLDATRGKWRRSRWQCETRSRSRSWPSRRRPSRGRGHRSPWCWSTMTRSTCAPTRRRCRSGTAANSCHRGWPAAHTVATALSATAPCAISGMGESRRLDDALPKFGNTGTSAWSCTPGRRGEFWRMGWDSNPRGAVHPCRFSRPVPSTARPPIRPLVSGA